MHSSWLEIKGIRQNNLKNIDIKIPHDRVIAITGLSGSGKSSLAFDTIFAEGQWRFIESLSTYAKLFLEKLDKPDIDEAENIRPAIALSQRNPVKGSRSTVGTVTEVYDLLRVVFAKMASPICPSCGSGIVRWDVEKVYEELITNHKDRRAMIMFETGETLTSLKERGFYRIYKDSETVDIFEIAEDAERHEVVLDRLIIADDPRLFESLELAWKEGDGKIKIMSPDGDSFTYSDKHSCDSCGRVLPEPMPILFSFNHPVGACPQCKGFGNVLIYDTSLVIPDMSLSLSEGAIEPFEKPGFSWWKSQLLRNAAKNGLDTRKPLQEFSPAEWEILYKGGSGLYGIDDFFEALAEKRYKLHVRVFLSKYRVAEVCPKCKGTRLKEEVLSYKIGGKSLADMNAMTVSELHEFLLTPPLTEHERAVIHEAHRHILAKLAVMIKMGLSYLTLDRQTMTLSGGEYQRVNLANQLSCRLAGTLYVLDEPTVGLHSRDNGRIMEIIKELSALGNTVIVVEHDPEIIAASDWVIELGPGGGKNGGNIVFSGTIADFRNSDTITAKYLSGETQKRKRLKRTPTGFIEITGAKGHNLNNVNLKIPANTLTVVTGVSGSGKSSLIVETLHRAVAKHLKHSVNDEKPLPYDSICGVDKLNGVCLVDQSPIGRTPRSNPATYMKFFDNIRKIFSEQTEAKIHGYTPGFFSFNVKGGRCEHCKGEGFEKLEMYFFEDLYVKCPQCKGMRYSEDALRITYRGLNISGVLGLTVDEALDVFNDDAAVVRKLQLLKDIGLGYLQIGQAATTLSGGEAQRLKICAELGTPGPNGILYVLDEPTIGLHMHDVTALMSFLNRLVNADNTVVVIEHNMDVIRDSDWVIDLGPEGGHEGGSIIFEGTPEELIESKGSHTGESLAKYILKT
ncbi:excinuclease ABC subunit UvrA [Candidatus Magnetomonas plexicatena]|uniref:excinuclease ABC subunit UvrA n=1 Tax=Candidatus Magnetomonas plexicatena TaxID=2552947 RepID=UPI001C777EC1|nr:excinuclease ABC subunit UvrA [Nitrospirales bacterium LBB_01]